MAFAKPDPVVFQPDIMYPSSTPLFGDNWRHEGTWGITRNVDRQTRNKAVAVLTQGINLARKTYQGRISFPLYQDLFDRDGRHLGQHSVHVMYCSTNGQLHQVSLKDGTNEGQTYSTWFIARWLPEQGQEIYEINTTGIVLGTYDPSPALIKKSRAVEIEGPYDLEHCMSLEKQYTDTFVSGSMR